MAVKLAPMIAQDLLRWYRTNQRDLPWRDSNDPYRIWLSEIILQQTRVQQGLPWYYSFISEFPSVQHLANASEEKVLKLWQGLGYYSRARNLHATAKSVTFDLHGVFPDEPGELQKLKGIGPYTAAAIASFAFGKPVVALDGNLLRVGSRLFGIETPVDLPDTRKNIEREFLNIMPRNASADFNQALMDLGAEICSPSSPSCHSCPVYLYCTAKRNGNAEKLPVKASKTAVKPLFVYYFILRSEKGILFRHRPLQGIWKNMYDFPAVESSHPLEPVPSPEIPGHLQTDSAPEYLGTLSHALSHRKIEAAFFLLDSSGFNPEKPFVWKSLDSYTDIPVPRLIDKALQKFSARIWQ